MSQSQTPTFTSPTTQPNPAIVPVRTEPIQMKNEEKFLESAHPLSTTCPSCNRAITTTLEPVPGRITYMSCIGCVLIGCWLGCFLLPFYKPECQDIEHICPECGYFFGRFQRC